MRLRLMVAKQRLPANIYESLCPGCGARVEFPLFQASFYDFATYQEAHSQKIFRLDLDACHYRNLTVADLLAEAHTLTSLSSDANRAPQLKAVVGRRWAHVGAAGSSANAAV